MRNPTPLEKAILRAVQKGADTRDKLVKELRYFDRADVEAAINRLISIGALESRVKGVIRKTEKLSVTSTGLEMEKMPSSLPPQKGEPLASPSKHPSHSSAPRRSRARALASAGSVAARGASIMPHAGKLLEDEEEGIEEDEEDSEEEEEKRRGFLDTIRSGIEEVREEVEEAVETIEEEIEDVIGEDEEEEEEY